MKINENNPNPTPIHRVLKSFWKVTGKYLSITKLTSGHVSKHLIQTTKMVAGFLSPQRHEVTLSFSVKFIWAIIDWRDWREYHAVDRVALPQTRGSLHQLLRGTAWNTPSLKCLSCQPR